MRVDIERGLKHTRGVSCVSVCVHRIGNPRNYFFQSLYKRAKLSMGDPREAAENRNSSGVVDRCYQLLVRTAAYPIPLYLRETLFFFFIFLSRSLRCDYYYPRVMTSSVCIKVGYARTQQVIVKRVWEKFSFSISLILMTILM